MSTIKELHEKWLEDPEYKKAYEELGPDITMARLQVESLAVSKETSKTITEELKKQTRLLQQITTTLARR